MGHLPYVHIPDEPCHSDIECKRSGLLQAMFSLEGLSGSEVGLVIVSVALMEKRRPPVRVLHLHRAHRWPDRAGL